MTDADRPKFAEAVAALAATFGRECDEVAFRGYWMGLDDLALDDVLRACKRALRERERMPTVAELRKLAGVMDDTDRALAAWSHFEQTAAGWGAYKTVDFDDKLINATVRHLGGWIRCCELPPNEFDTWLRKDFLKAYESFCKTGVGREAYAPLMGIHERENRLIGYDPKVMPKLEEGDWEPLKITTGLPPHRAVPALPSKRQDRMGEMVAMIPFKRP